MRKLVRTALTFAVPMMMAGLFIAATASSADAGPNGPPFNPPGPPPWLPNRLNTVPLPATGVLFGIGLLALPWLRSKGK
jgi:hypothetical protein